MVSIATYRLALSKGLLRLGEFPRNQALNPLQSVQAVRVDFSRHERDSEPAFDESDKANHADGVD
jgi:hypothetical protein